MLLEMAQKTLEEEGLPREAFPYVVRLYALAARGRKGAPKPWLVRQALRAAGAEGTGPPPEGLRPLLLGRLRKRVEEILLEVPLRLLGGEALREEVRRQGPGLMRRGLSGLEAVVLLLWEEEAAQGGNWWTLREKLLGRLGWERAWDLVLVLAYTRIRALGLAPGERGRAQA